MPARQINLDLIFSISQIQQSPQDLHDFLRAYYHVKSADWSANQPMPLKASQAEVLAALPHYDVMPCPSTMADAVTPFMPTASQIQTCTWLTDSDLAVYVAEYARRSRLGHLPVTQGL